MSLAELMAGRLAVVEGRIAAACARAGRAREGVTLVAVTKYVPDEVVALLPGLGVRDLGESRPQELWRRAANLPDVRWHVIGHLQRNKLDRTLPLTYLLHSADSARLLSAAGEWGVRHGRRVDVLLEVNAADDPNKSGFAPDGLIDELRAIPASALDGVRLRGLMCMAALSDDPEASRPAFIRLRELRGRVAEVFGPAHQLEHLSMGMSTDFEVGIEEGATLIRVGSALFEGMA